LSWIDANLHLTLYLIPLFAFAEACIGVGLFVSGVFLVVICSLAFDQQLASLPLITLLAFVGALLGDHVGYYIGKSFGPHFHRMSIVQKRREAISKAEDMIKRYGPFAVFVGRFIPAIRSLIPALLGITNFAKVKFSLLDSLACFLWSLALASIVAGLEIIF
tara:strand:- start:1 stop:486 length:486 start_codon:yes stop_codon:yes gene_type:complete